MGYHGTVNIQQFFQVLKKYSRTQKFPEMKISLLFILSTAALINGEKPRISYGSRATAGQFKFAASIYGKGRRMCNGAILSEFYVITAGHCIHNEMIADLRVIVGSISVSKSTNWRQVQNTHLFSGYEPNGSANDIGIIQLKESLVYNNKIQPITYETAENAATHYDCSLVRFKNIEDSSIHQCTRSLWWQTVIITTHDYCKSVYSYLHVTERCIFTPLESVRNPRPGDSGAPIICNGKLTAILTASMDDETDAEATVIMVAPYQQWIGDKIY